MRGFSRMPQSGRGWGSRAGAPLAVCSVRAKIPLFPSYPDDLLSPGTFAPLGGRQGGRFPLLVLPAGSLCAGKASCQRISSHAFYIHPWCDHTSFREEASGMDLS